MLKIMLVCYVCVRVEDCKWAASWLATECSKWEEASARTEHEHWLNLWRWLG